MRRAYLVLAVLAVAAGALLFGSRLPGLGNPPTTVETTSTTSGLTGPERAWCENHAGRVANTAYFEYRDSGAPAMLESERLSGELQPATLDTFTAWAADHPDLYDRSCAEAFDVWAGQ